MLGGQPTPFDPLEARRLHLTLLLLSSVLAESERLRVETEAPREGRSSARGRSAAGKRRHVRPARSC